MLSFLSTAVAIAYGLKSKLDSATVSTNDEKVEMDDRSTEVNEDKGSNKETPEKAEETLESEIREDVEGTAGPQHVLVCDLGGSMLDMSIVSVNGIVFDVLATGGDANLGMGTYGFVYYITIEMGLSEST